MNTLFEVLAVLLFVVGVLAFTFVFHGEPDLWDKWHAEAMGKNCVAVTVRQGEVKE